MSSITCVFRFAEREIDFVSAAKFCPAAITLPAPRFATELVITIITTTAAAGNASLRTLGA